MMAPQMTTTKPAPADRRTSRTFSSNPVGAASSLASSLKEYWVLAMHTGSLLYPSAASSSSVFLAAAE